MFLVLIPVWGQSREQPVEVVTVGWPCCRGLSIDERQGAMILKFRTLHGIKDSVSCSAVTWEKKGDLTALCSERWTSDGFA